MKSDRWKQLDVLFHSALERAPSERAAFLSEACDGDEDLRGEIESLLASHQQAGNFIECPAHDIAADLFAKHQISFAAGQVLGPYRIVKLLGTGGMGEVYLAEDVRLGRRVALKMLPARFTEDHDRLRRFEREARAASVLNHPNIVTIHEIGESDGAHFIVTEFIEGQTLRQRMAGKRMRLVEALDVAIQVTSALAPAHKAGIVHRDIKPENIMLRPDGLIKVLDFGLAKLTESQTLLKDTEAPTIARTETESGFVMGTVTYMSPEQARGLIVDARTDIFSVGVVLYEMIAGHTPFDGATSSDMIAAILREEPEPLNERSPEAPAELDWVIQKALAKDREERYQTIKELLIDLKRLVQELERTAKLNLTPVTRSSGTTADSRFALDAGATKRKTRAAAPPVRTVIILIAAIAIFSIASYYAGLNRAPAPVHPTFRALTFRRGTISMARFGPDSKTIIYSAAFDGKPVELFTTRVESPESSPVKLQFAGRTIGIQSISSAGEMAVLLDCELDKGDCINGTLARVPLVGGTPREVMEDVHEADWSPDGQKLAVVHVNDEGQYQLEYPIGTVLYKSTGDISQMRVSPKGDMIAFVDHPVLGRLSGNVVAVDLNGQKRVLSPGWTSAKGLAWSPPGDEVWFSAARDWALALHAVTMSGRERLLFQAPLNLRLYDISRDGQILIAGSIPRSHMMSVTPGSEKERVVDWFARSTSADISDDGKNLLFYEWDDDVVYLRKMDGSNDPIRLGHGKAFALSPDGKWALALQETSPPQLVLLSTGPGEPRLLPPGEIVEYHYASWFPDGKKILFTALTEQGGGLRSYVQDIDGGPARPITEEGMIALSVSPDGTRLFAWAPDKGLDGKYYLCPINGTPPIPINALELGEVPIQWGADGRSLYVCEYGDFKATISRINLATGRRDLRKEIVPDRVGLMGFEIKPGGIKITPDGKSYVYTYWTLLQDLFLMGEVH